MTVYVDELRPYPKTRNWPFGGACHLTADTDEELHDFAAKIGMKRIWWQHPPKASRSHYDLAASRREAALKAGAVFVPVREQAKRTIEERRRQIEER